MNFDRLGELDFRDKRVTVVGLGTEGLDMVRYLASRGAYVTVSDAKPAEKLGAAVEEVLDLPVRLSLGANRTEDFVEADAVFVSQSVPLELPALDEARRRGIPVHSMLSLFLELCPGPIAGITGSSGKTTTTALLGEMFRVDERPVFVGGNIGVGLLEHLPEVRPYTWSVLEVSHTQLQLAQRSPHVAGILNVTPNHLDRFSWDEYRRLKGNLIRYQGPPDTAVLGYDDLETRAMAGEVRGRLLWFSAGSQLPGDGTFVKGGWVMLTRGRLRERLFRSDALHLPGRHNLSNAVAAAALASACGISPEAIACAVEGFRGVPHRLEFVAEAGGVRYFNDSIATTPERTLAGIHSFSEPLVLLLGGRDKQLPLEELADEACRRCRAIVLFGESAGKLAEALRHVPSGPPVVRADGLAQAVEEAHALARPGDVVLLSPACTSYDAYDNFERRGEHFRTLVQRFVKEVAPSLP